MKLSLKEQQGDNSSNNILVKWKQNLAEWRNVIPKQTVGNAKKQPNIHPPPSSVESPNVHDCDIRYLWKWAKNWFVDSLLGISFYTQITSSVLHSMAAAAPTSQHNPVCIERVKQRVSTLENTRSSRHWGYHYWKWVCQLSVYCISSPNPLSLWNSCFEVLTPVSQSECDLTSEIGPFQS